MADTSQLANNKKSKSENDVILLEFFIWCSTMGLHDVPKLACKRRWFSLCRESKGLCIQKHSKLQHISLEKNNWIFCFSICSADYTTVWKPRNVDIAKWKTLKEILLGKVWLGLENDTPKKCPCKLNIFMSNFLCHLFDWYLILNFIFINLAGS